MEQALSRFTASGLDEFARWLEAASSDPVPAYLLGDPTYAEPVPEGVRIALEPFKNRYDFGCFLVDLLGELDQQAVSFDRGLWTWLAAFFFEQICPVLEGAKREFRKSYVYVLSGSRVYYRHLVRTPWYLVRTHGEECAFMLMPRPGDKAPLARQSDLLDQFAARQFVISSTSLIAAARQLYSSPLTGQPVGRQGRGPGSPRRLALIANQLSLTYDIHNMPVGQLLTLLPKEFGVASLRRMFP